MIPPSFENLDWLALLHFGELMPQVITSDIDIGLIIAQACRIKNKVSAYAPDPFSIDKCMSSPNWQKSSNGENTWWQSILTEIANFKNNNVYTIVPKRTVTERGHTIFPTLINFLTKRTKESTPEREMIDKRKCRIVFAGNRCIPGRDYLKTDAYAPVPGWGVVKLQLSLAALHGLKLKAFDCTAAYLQTPITDKIYCHPPKGLMQLLGENPDDVWNLKRALYGHPLSAKHTDPSERVL